MFSDYHGIKLEISNRKIRGKSLSTWKLNNRFLSNPWVTEEESGEIRMYFELDENGSTTYQSLWDAAKALNGYIRKEGRSQITNLNFHLKKLQKEE